ncbi:hypothetical protein HaLaN_29936, partial [Haematococcus lacustris]
MEYTRPGKKLSKPAHCPGSGPLQGEQRRNKGVHIVALTGCRLIYSLRQSNMHASTAFGHVPT